MGKFEILINGSKWVVYVNYDTMKHGVDIEHNGIWVNGDERMVRQRLVNCLREAIGFEYQEGDPNDLLMHTFDICAAVDTIIKAVTIRI